MDDLTSKAPTKVETKPAAPYSAPDIWRPFESLRRQVDRIFEDFDRIPWQFPVGRAFFDLEPLTKRATIWNGLPAVDVAEKDKQYEITVELPGLDERDVDVKVANGVLTIKGEKREEREEKKKDYYVAERHYGSFRRSFNLPEGVDTDKIGASFKKGVLTLTLPKTAVAQSQEKKIAVTAG